MKYRKMMLVLAMTAALGASGCGKASGSAEEVTPTPVPTEVPTPVPTVAPTEVPAPTEAPTPRAIGEKTNVSNYVYLTNGAGSEIRELYLRASGVAEWGNNLVPPEAAIQAGEQVQMYYIPAAGAAYDMRIVDGTGSAYEIGNFNLADMEMAELRIENGAAYLSYMSLSQQVQMTTNGSTPVENNNSAAETGSNSGNSGGGTDSGDVYIIYNKTEAGSTDTGKENDTTPDSGTVTPVPDTSGITEIPDPPDPNPSVTGEPIISQPAEPTISENPITPIPDPPDPEPPTPDPIISEDPEPVPPDPDPDPDPETIDDFE